MDTETLGGHGTSLLLRTLFLSEQNEGLEPSGSVGGVLSSPIR